MKTYSQPHTVFKCLGPYMGIITDKVMDFVRTRFNGPRITRYCKAESEGARLFFTNMSEKRGLLDNDYLRSYRVVVC